MSGAFDPARTPKRADMVRYQIEGRGITSKAVLEAMRSVPRHEFVPAELQRHAYDDRPLPIGEGQTISQPFIVALMTELANIDENSRVLEIGTGSGYQTAVLASISSHVYSVEIVPTLAAKARGVLHALRYSINLRCGDGYAGWPEASPFDAIVLTAAPPQIPDTLVEQLADGGRLVAPVGDTHQELVLLERHGSVLNRSSITPVRFVPMTGGGHTPISET